MKLKKTDKKINSFQQRALSNITSSGQQTEQTLKEKLENNFLIIKLIATATAAIFAPLYLTLSLSNNIRNDPWCIQRFFINNIIFDIYSVVLIILAPAVFGIGFIWSIKEVAQIWKNECSLFVKIFGSVYFCLVGAICAILFVLLMYIIISNNGADVLSQYLPKLENVCIIPKKD